MTDCFTCQAQSHTDNNQCFCAVTLALMPMSAVTASPTLRANEIKLLVVGVAQSDITCLISDFLKSNSDKPTNLACVCARPRSTCYPPAGAMGCVLFLSTCMCAYERMSSELHIFSGIRLATFHAATMQDGDKEVFTEDSVSHAVSWEIDH